MARSPFFPASPRDFALPADQVSQVIDDSLAEAARQNRQQVQDRLAAMSEDEKDAARRRLMRVSYDAKVAAGELVPLPADLVGWSVGAITIIGQSPTVAGDWRVRNTAIAAAVATTTTEYDVHAEAVMDMYAQGWLQPPSASAKPAHDAAGNDDTQDAPAP